MQTQDRILIQAPWKKVYRAAAKVEAWPALLSHYRHVRVLSGQGPWRIVDMAAWRDLVPCRWVAEQRLHPGRKRVQYRHILSRFTQGMEVWWILRPRGPRATEVLLTHAMPDGPWWLRGFRRRVVLRLFVDVIAGRTLAGLKRHLEAR